eukprot:392007-Lingulodinium_polyedra.AAC.1
MARGQVAELQATLRVRRARARQCVGRCVPAQSARLYEHGGDGTHLGERGFSPSIATCIWRDAAQ